MALRDDHARSGAATGRWRAAWVLLGALLLLAGLPEVLFAQAVPDARAIDRRVRRTPDSLRRDLPALTDHLVQGLNADADKARVLYAWVTRNIEYDSEASARPGWRLNRSVGDILRRGRAICFGYAQLMCAMSERAGLPCFVVDGYSKGTPTARPGLQEPDHAWNAIRIDGTWQLLDATWGTAPGTAPETFILDHLPAMPMWQLLPCPVPARVFQGPAEATGAWLAGRDSCYAYPDSIEAWAALPLPQRALARARTAYRFHPTPANAGELGHSYLDLAGRLADETDRLQREGKNDSLIHVQEEIIRSCASARRYVDSLYGWQHELCLGALLNQAVATVRRANTMDPPPVDLYRQAVRYLEEAKRMAGLLPGGSLYARQVQRQAEAYLDMLKKYLDDP